MTNQEIIETLCLIWTMGLLTGAGASYLACLLFCRRMLAEGADLLGYQRNGGDNA